MRELNIENQITISETDFKNAGVIARSLAGILQNVDTNNMLNKNEKELIQKFCDVANDINFALAIGKIIVYYKKKGDLENGTAMV